MGRPFEKELGEIEETCQRFSNADTLMFEEFVLRNLEIPFLAIGSGGSYSVACAFEALISAMGGICKKSTPSELLSERALTKYAVIMFTARGNNTDIINTYKYVRLNEPIDKFVLCFSKKSKLVKLCNDMCDDGIFSMDLAPSRDGFLAVNSIVAALGIFQHFYCKHRLHETMVSMARCTSLAQNKVVNSTYIIAIAGAGLMPVAIDFESKCSEAGLVAVQPVAFRNFAHGRHNWVSKHENDTSVVAFISPAESKAISKMLESLPDIPKLVLTSIRNGYLANLELFPKMFELVNAIGRARRIDPGRPGVSAYGRKIYASSRSALANDSELRSRMRSTVKRAAWRKTDPSVDLCVYKRYEGASKAFIEQLRRTRFDALALDFDGTIISKGSGADSVCQKNTACLSRIINEGVTVGFATGRGRSILEYIDSSFTLDERRSIFVVMHNGLSQAYYDGDEWIVSTLNNGFVSSPTALEEDIHNELIRIGVDSEWCSFSEDGHISVRVPPEKADYASACYAYLLNYVDSTGVPYKVLRSGHSFDIVISQATKSTIFDVMAQHHCSKVLAIGDCGERLGGDFEMLHTGVGLSVGSVSCSLSNCWNVAPLGLRGPLATQYYLEHISVKNDGTFVILV